jgi:hypothetical protein
MKNVAVLLANNANYLDYFFKILLIKSSNLPLLQQTAIKNEQF